MKPYSINGIRYEPKVPNIGETFQGVASWYGPDFHGGKTSNGEYYDMTAFTAAHKTLPMNTQVRVTNLDNGRSTIVRINDRGPFVANRIIDLSYAAAKEIGMIKKGTARVKLEVIDYDTSVDRYKHYEPFPNAVESISKLKQTPKTVQIKPIEKVKVAATPVTSKKVKIKKDPFPNYEVQIFSSTNQSRAKQMIQKYTPVVKPHKVKLEEHINNGRKIYAVVVGDFPTKNHAKAFIINKGFSGALIVKD
jgi:rare lipoprotein A